MGEHYDPSICDLCGSDQSALIVQLSSGRSMRSDRTVVSSDLSKIMCARCGLVRSGQPVDGAILADYYSQQYTVSEHLTEHFFYTPTGPVARSVVICDWMVSATGAHRWRTSARCLEIGAGSGALMREFVRRFPGSQFVGMEMNESAAAIARERGLSIFHSTLHDLDRGVFNMAYAVAVIEHVPSPSQFLLQVRERLDSGGWLVLLQPTQDVSSYDMFFIDHLYHFGTDHLRQYARKCGFREQGFIVGHEWMPNFSLHLWRVDDPVSGVPWTGQPGYTTCIATARQISDDLARLESTLSVLISRKRRVAVFGLSEAYWFLRAYSSLGVFPIVCGLDDRPDRPEYTGIGFPVMVPEQCMSWGIQDVVLTMNKVYYPQARERIERLGLVPHPVFG
jgi:SAM-dependent methyltransferase